MSKENLSLGFTRIHCPFENCEKSYQNKNSLLEHYRLYPTYKPASLSLNTTRKRVSAKDCALEFLDEKRPYSREKRVRELLNSLPDSRLLEFILPRVTTLVTPVEFLIQGTSGPADVYRKFQDLKTELGLQYPDLNPLLCQESLPPPTPNFERLQFTELATRYKPQSCHWILAIDDGSFFRNCVMPQVLKNEHDAFLEFCCGIVG